MGKVDYKAGISILQLIVFPFILAAGLFIWMRTGWRVGVRIWLRAVTLSLIRIAGSIAGMIRINHDSVQVETAVVVCELIGIAPLLLIYVGILRQIDLEERIPARGLNLLSIVGIVGLIVGIAGVSSNNGPVNGQLESTNLTKASMGIFIALFVILVLATAFLAIQPSTRRLKFQKKLFLSVILAMPFVLVRIVYSAISNYSNKRSFDVLVGNQSIYLCMSVLEEIVAMVITMGFGVSAVLEDDFVRLHPNSAVKDERVSGVQYNGV